jgi:hypothetical protein
MRPLSGQGDSWKTTCSANTHLPSVVMRMVALAMTRFKGVSPRVETGTGKPYLANGFPVHLVINYPEIFLK